MTFAPGSTLWLLRHELVLLRRRAPGRSSRAIAIGAGALVFVALHVAAWLLLAPTATATVPAFWSALFALSVWSIGLLMLAQAINRSIAALFDRGDLDLVLAAPVEPRSVFAVRAVAVAASIAVGYLLFFAPFGHVGALTGRPELLAVYPAVIAFALFATALGMTTTLALVRALGARRARVVAQLLAAFVGAGLFLVFQLGPLLGADVRAAWTERLRREAEGSGWLRAASPLWWPADALRGRVGPLVAVVAIGVVAFALAVRVVASTFVSGTQEAIDAGAARAPTAAALPRFRGGLFRLLIAKEWKLLRRDPQLLAQTLLPVLFLVPLVVVVPGSTGLAGTAVVPIVLAATTLVDGLAWLAVAAEDAPELLAAAPVAARRVVAAKLLAVLLPVWVLVVPALAFVGVDLGDGWRALVPLACVLAATLSAAAIQLATARPGRRQDLQRRGRGNAASTTVSLVSASGWCLLAATLPAAPAWSAVGALLVVVAAAAAALIAARRRRLVHG